jgi:hypothetical protein
MEGMNESYSHSSFFIATVRQNKDFQISHTLKLAWVLSSCMFREWAMVVDRVSGHSGPKSIRPNLKLNTFELKKQVFIISKCF